MFRGRQNADEGLVFTFNSGGTLNLYTYVVDISNEATTPNPTATYFQHNMHF
jgi:hypothetical protein